MIAKKDKEEIQNYLVDAANFKGSCDAVYFPESEDEIITLLKKANDSKTPVTVSGNGTGLTGGRVPLEGIVISMEKLNDIVEIDEREKYAVVLPGVILNEFQKTLENKNLFYPPDPTETNCFIGSTVATNASGAKSFKYGSTRNFVLELRIILPDGDSIDLKRGENFAVNKKLKLKTEGGRTIDIDIPGYRMPRTKNAAGYFCGKNMDAIDLFIGSEGTLGVFSKIKLRLIDLPENILSSVIFFNREDSALDFIDNARELSKKNSAVQNNKNINALGLEFFDVNALDFLKPDYPNIPVEAKAAVWFEQEINSNNEGLILSRWLELIHKYNGNDETSWFAASKKDRERFKDFRHAVSWKVSEYIAQHNVMKVGTDTAVPVSNFRQYFSEAKRIVEESNLRFLIYGHVGDCHIHLNMLPGDEAEYNTAKKIYTELCRRAVDLNGTVSAEHGIGKLKRDYLKILYGDEGLKQMAKIKKTLDPNKILGLGNIFDTIYLM